MNFDEFDSKMRAYEKTQDSYIDKDCFLCARLDGKGFSKFTAEKFNKPYDIRFFELMLETTEHLMTCGFNIMLGYTQSDEISLLFHPADDTYNHKTRKLLSVLAGQASAFFSVKAGTAVCFDCRLIPLPDTQAVKDYFAWRQDDLFRNSLDSCCYYALLDKGMDYLSATHALEGKQPDYKIRLLEDHGIDYHALPDWQKSGAVLYFGNISKEGVNKKTGEAVIYSRRRVITDQKLPTGEKYGDYIISLIEKTCENKIPDKEN